MSSTTSTNGRSTSYDNTVEGLDVDWLLHSKRDFPSQSKDNVWPKHETQTSTPAPNPRITSDPPQTQQNAPVPTTPQSAEMLSRHPTHQPDLPSPSSAASRTSTRELPPSTSGLHSTVSRTVSNDEPARGGKTSTPKKEGRKSSWISSIGHKLSGGGGGLSRSSSVSSQHNKSPLPSPGLERGDPLDKKGTNGGKEGQIEPPMAVPSSPRRPSVLVAAGSETKLEQPSFLTSALRRLSSGNTASLGKGAGQGALCPRKVMNIDPNRDRVRVPDLDQSKLRRVAFRVDVEIAGVASHAEEQHGSSIDPPRSNQSHAMEKTADKDSKSAKYKDKGEGAALKSPQKASQERDELGQTKADAVLEATEAVQVQTAQQDDTAGNDEPVEGDHAAPTTTRKKQKKKRSEAERKERKEKKRRLAEANGLVPLEIIRDDDDSDSTPSTTPPGASTPRRVGDHPTTDPLRIYKRCCQLRESTALNTVKDQITKPAATLAEAPGTVAVVNLAGTQMTLPDVITLSDWLAVVPVRKLILDDCGLTDEAIRVILAGLLSCKSFEQTRQNRKLPKSSSGKRGQEQMCVIERLSLKNNSGITSLGWKHIALFMHMSRSLRAIDLSGIPFPAPSDMLTKTDSILNSPANPHNGTHNASGKVEVGALVARAISERLAGPLLEELIMSGCAVAPDYVSSIADAAVKCKIKRLGLAGNSLDPDGLEHVVRYVRSGVCEGLDLGSNNLHLRSHVLTEALDEDNPLIALSIADCNLAATDINSILSRFTRLKNFKFIDISQNKDLFDGTQNAASAIRKHLPKMTALKRIHLANVGLGPDHVIALAEIFPDCEALAHVSLLENEKLVSTMNGKSAESQEEAAAFLASLMTAVRVSETIAAIEIEVPSADSSSEVVRALSSQIVAYGLRNMERSALTEAGIKSTHMPDKDAPEVLLHLVGHMDGYSAIHDNDEPAPDEDYLIASTGIVKALGVCLRTKDGSRTVSTNISPTASGTVTPRHGAIRSGSLPKPKDVSRELCESARKIRMRLQPALVKEDRAGNRDAYRRLYFLDQTLQDMIRRFEDAYPEAKPIPDASSNTPPTPLDLMSPGESPDLSRVNSAVDNGGPRHTDESLEHHQENEADDTGLMRTPSNQSLAAKALAHEEGRMHRFGQVMRRELLKPTGTDDFHHGTSVYDEPEPAHLSALRTKLEGMRGDEIRASVEELGADEVIKQIGINAEELRLLRDEDPVGFEAFRNSQMAAQMNIGV